MGQYFAIYNLDKQQMINPGRWGDGLRLREFGSSSCGVLLALAALLAHGNEYGGIRSRHEMIGAWAGDRIATTRDYTGLSRFEADLAHFSDVSEHILQALCEDTTLKIRLLGEREIEPPQPQPLAILKEEKTRDKLP